MSTNGEKNLDSSFIEKVGEALSGISESVGGFLTRLFGSSNERYIRNLGYIRASNPDHPYHVTPGSILDKVNQLEEQTRALSDEELKGLTPKFRERLANGETLEDILPEAFAACREAARRTKNMRHFDVQILGGVVLHRGNIAEMVTGEGKTLVATLPGYLNGIEGKGVHVVTVNDYLARRDCEWMLPIYRALGLTAGFIQSDMDPVARRQAYDCDITYGTNSEFGFDYLRDNMKPARWGDQDYDPWFHQCQKALHYAIIDEVDNILVDEARTPLIISGPAFGDIRRYAKANEIAVKLTELERQARGQRGIGRIPTEPKTENPEEEKAAAKTSEAPDTEASLAEPAKKGKNAGEQPVGVYFEVKEKERTCHLTDEGIRKAEELAGVESFYTAGNMEWPHLIDNSLRAHHLYRKDKEYVVMRHPESNEMSIIIVDEFTGRLMIGRQWSDGLHQSVEAKHGREGVKIKEETQTLATITLQNFFKLYKKLAGMTGTAMTEANEFWKIYKLDVIAIPTNKPLIRVNSSDVIFRSEKEKWDAIVTEVVEVNKEGRPMLIGTTDVEKSEKLAAMLKRRGIKHELLNAKPEFAAREAEIVAQAGRIGAVTIATNMAGRGTDIILGGNPETMAWAKLKNKYATRLDVPEDEWKGLVHEIESGEKMKEEGRKVAGMGGLHIIGTERHEARRIDNQLRGRAGRQGDPGSSRFYLSLQDDLMRIFAGEWVANVLTRMGMEDGQAIESRMVSRRIEAAQKKVEERNFDIRKNLLEYDEVMDHQRKRVYGFRQEVLDGANCKLRILEFLDEQVNVAVDRILDDDYGPATFAEFAGKQLGVEFDANEFARSDFTEACNTARNKATRMIPTQIQEALDENLSEDVDTKEWNWQAMANAVNTRWGLKTTDRQLKQIGRDNLSGNLMEQAEKVVNEVDLTEGGRYLEPEYGLRSICDWARTKFQIELSLDELANLEADQIKTLLHGKVMEIYRQKEIEFPVRVAMARFMSDKSAQPGTGQRYDREGLYRWAAMRFPGQIRQPAAAAVPAGVGAGGMGTLPTPISSASANGHLNEEEFRTQSRLKLQDLLLEVSKKCFPELKQDAIDAKLEESLEGAAVSELEDARELAEWARENYAVDVPVESLTGVSKEAARQALWNAFDQKYRPEMKRMERSLLLGQLDSSWKNHLYTMDHLRSGIGLVGYAQVDPKTEYKRQGMKEFESMWEGLQDKVTDVVFRMEEEESFQESVWAIGAAVHESAPRPMPMDERSMRGQQQAAIAGSQGDKKIEPIRNRGERVGRNDPCPCGSGKKYKNCHMRQVG